MCARIGPECGRTRVLQEVGGTGDLLEGRVHVGERLAALRRFVETVPFSDAPDAAAWTKHDWHFQSCGHDFESGEACRGRDACWSACPAELSALLGTSQLFSYKMDGHPYHAMRTPLGDVVQQNTKTKRKRWMVKRVVIDLCKSLQPGQVATPDHISFLVATVGATADTGPHSRIAWLETRHDCDMDVRELFIASATEGGASMRSWARESKKTVAIQSVGWVRSPVLAEAFLVTRAHASSSLCLLGFHGTFTTPPSTVILGGGLDPRFSGSDPKKLFLGFAGYMSMTPHYCHTKGFVHECADGSFQVLLVCFLPGKPYHEAEPASVVASARRVPPPGFDTVTCVTQDTRVWAIYERQRAYPLAVLTYTVS